MKLPTFPSDVERAILDYGKQIAGEVNGKTYTNIDKSLLTLNAHQAEKPEFAKALLQMFQDASKREQEFNLALIADVYAYKNEWGPKFAAARLAGKPLPRQYPDPDDIVICDNLTVKFLGPVTADDAAKWEFFKRGREVYFSLAREIIEMTNCTCSLEEGRERYLKLRRQFYRVNRHLPKDFKRKHPAKFPPFNPTPGCPPDWDDEDDENPIA
ncbi:hypothetical protein M9978_16850 [Sphingomonas sp. MG17]|uniref:Uncharacterized protein n=1 Tax=Sphingomonas tagetis TaxID=2949092 RepID=A0A9X2HR67_9SPHN|nr:hypothetical protein [Sphingomonas tagetis]MCP3732094.1 hypothetical protein [Sphingomonas tagetis]